MIFLLGLREFSAFLLHTEGTPLSQIHLTLPHISPWGLVFKLSKSVPSSKSGHRAPVLPSPIPTWTQVALSTYHSIPQLHETQDKCITGMEANSSLHSY